MKPDINRLIDLQKLLLAFNHVERRVYRKHNGEYVFENDTEHSYNLGMTAWFLCKWFPELDANKVLKIALAHDFVEIHAGDTYIYGTPEELASKKSRESAAQKQLQSDWPDFDELHDAIDAYESKLSNESKFVYALDKIMPVMAIYINDGYNWKKHGITIEMLRGSKEEKVNLSPEILPYYTDLLAILGEHPELIQPR